MRSTTSKAHEKTTFAYADKATEFEVAMKQLKIPFDHLLPHHPENNSLAERNKQFIMTTRTTCLLEAGPPPVSGIMQWSVSVIY